MKDRYGNMNGLVSKKIQ